MSATKRMMIIGGDTGGHLYPAISTAGMLKDEFEPFFLIGGRPVVKEIMDKNRMPYRILEGRPFPRFNLLKYPGFVFSVLSNFIKSWRIISEVNPSIMFSTGGYMSFAPVVCAAVRRVPVIIHEQNISPGLANIILNCIADKTVVSFMESRKEFVFKNRVTAAGNPIRPELSAVSKKASGDKLAVLVLGGSQGAAFLNKLLVDSIELLEGSAGQLEIRHITGSTDYDSVKSSYERSNIKHEVYRYHHNIEELYSNSNLVISRSGAGTVFELIALKMPAVLVPFPCSAGNHQHHNAYYLAKNGCVLIYGQNKINPIELSEIFKKFINDKILLKRMSENFLKLPEAALDAGSIIKKEILELI